MTPDDNISRGTEGILESSSIELQPVLVEAIDGPGKGARHQLTRGSMSVGSDAGCDLPLDDRSVSRHHATIELLPGAVTVRDLGSRNGTFYLGARIEQARVTVGGSIQLGRTTLRFTPIAEDLPSSTLDELHGLIGKSLAMRKLFSVLQRLGPSDSSVLIRGESGAGKEAVAQALHGLSPRAEKPFVVFECAAVNPNIVESELFGHVRGAFTGADRQRLGAVETASGGTLLLDEIGAFPLELQPKLLRVLEAREFRRVGETLMRPANIRVLATTQRDIEADSASGRFRSDLYFRLAVTVIEVPPLRRRLDDIPLLATHFAKKLTGIDVPLAAPTLAALQCDSWPGNVRELRNAVERVVALGSMGVWTPSTEPDDSPSFKEMRDRVLHQFERDYLAALLSRHKGNVSAAAREARLARSQFYRLLARHGLDSGKD